MADTSSLNVLILAAGKGTRMKSEQAKVLHEVFYAPMVHHVLNAVTPLHPSRTIAIIGHQREAVQQSLADFNVEFVVQENQLGTGHAVLAAESTVPEGKQTVMILCGDTPLIRPETLKEMHGAHQQSTAALTIMTTLLDEPTNYGRILLDAQHRVTGIVEEKDASPAQKEIKEINAGIYCIDRDFLFQALHQVGTDNSQGEVYLTDIVKIAVEAGQPVDKFATPHAGDVLGVNSRVELAAAHSELQQRRNRALMLEGVTMHNPATISVSPDSSIGQDSLLLAGVHITGNTQIGSGCHLSQGVLVHNCRIGDNVHIGPYSCLAGMTVPANTVVPPFSTALS